MSKYKWKKIAGFSRGHQYFKDEISGRVSVCDESGDRPDQTDDGVLWLDYDRPIRPRTEDDAYYDVPVFKVRDAEHTSFAAKGKEADWVLRRWLEHDGKIPEQDFYAINGPAMVEQMKAADPWLRELFRNLWNEKDERRNDLVKVIRAGEALIGWPPGVKAPRQDQETCPHCGAVNQKGQDHCSECCHSY